MPTAKEKDEAKAPASQKTDNKRDETGTIKNTSGNSKKANESAKTSGVVTGDKTANKEPEPLEASNVKVEGEVLQGDSFRINVTRGALTMHIPVPIEGTNNVQTLNNAMKLVSKALELNHEKEMRDTFGSLIA